MGLQNSSIRRETLSSALVHSVEDAPALHYKYPTTTQVNPSPVEDVHVTRPPLVVCTVITSMQSTRPTGIQQGTKNRGSLERDRLDNFTHSMRRSAVLFCTYWIYRINGYALLCFQDKSNGRIKNPQIQPPHYSSSSLHRLIRPDTSILLFTAENTRTVLK